MPRFCYAPGLAGAAVTSVDHEIGLWVLVRSVCACGHAHRHACGHVRAHLNSIKIERVVVSSFRRHVLKKPLCRPTPSAAMYARPSLAFERPFWEPQMRNGSIGPCHDASKVLKYRNRHPNSIGMVGIDRKAASDRSHRVGARPMLASLLCRFVAAAGAFCLFRRA